MRPDDPLHLADDHRLMALAGTGRREAFDALAQRHRGTLLGLFRRFGATHDAEDLAQETFVRLLRCLQRYRPTAKFLTFLYTLARNVWLDSLRRKRTRDAAHLTLCESIDAWPASRTRHGPGSALDLADALRDMPPKLRAVVNLSFFEGLRHEDIARTLGIPVGTVKSRMFLAMEFLSEWFGENETRR